MPGIYKNNRGFSLLEILISLVVLGIGLIGLGGLHLVSLKGANEAHYRSEAVMLVMDMADRMRANQAGVDDGHYDNGESPVSCENTVDSCLGADSTCDSQKLADFDLYQIACGMDGKSGGVRHLLPSGNLIVNNETDNAVIQSECLGAPSCLRINIDWQEIESEDQNSEHTQRSIQQWIVP